MYQDHSGIWSRCGCVLGLWWNGRRQSMGAFTFLVVFRSYNHTIWAVLGSVLIDFVQGFLKRWFPFAFLGKYHYLIVALHALRNMTKKIQLSFLTLYVLYFDAKLDLLFPAGNTWLEVGWNSFSSFAESWQDVETFLIFLSIEPRQCKHFKNWENLHQPTWSGWGKLFNRKRAFYAFSPEEVKMMVRWENQVVQLAREYSLYIQSPWAKWNETFEGKIVERNLIEKKK